MTSKPPDRTSDTGRTAALLMALQGVALVGFAGLLVVDVLRGTVDSTTQGLTEAGFVVIFAVAAFSLAKGLLGGSGWARTPSVVWNLLLLPVAYSLFTAGRPAPGALVLLLALLTLVMVWRTPPIDLTED